MKLVYGIRKIVGESVDMKQERINRALEAENEEIWKEHRQNMADIYMERKFLVDEFEKMFEPIWCEMVSLRNSEQLENEEAHSPLSESGHSNDGSINGSDKNITGNESGHEYLNETRDQEISSDECGDSVEGVRPSPRRKKPNWLLWLEKQKLFGYFREDRSTESDEKMKQFVAESNLDRYIAIFIVRINPWLVSMKKKIDNLPRKPLCLRKELIMKEVELLSKFYYARMLNKPELVRDHEKILTELMHQAAMKPRFKPADSWMSMMPLISFEHWIRIQRHRMYV